MGVPPAHAFSFSPPSGGHGSLDPSSESSSVQHHCQRSYRAEVGVASLQSVLVVGGEARVQKDSRGRFWNEEPSLFLGTMRPGLFHTPQGKGVLLPLYAIPSVPE